MVAVCLPINVEYKLDNLEKLNNFRKKLETLNEEKMKLQGELSAHKKSIEELKKECQEKFKCAVEELPSLVKKINVELEEILSEVEGMLEVAEK